MWAIDNRTRFSADRAFARDRTGMEIWVVAVRGTFDILSDGTVKPARDQQPVCLAPSYRGEPGASSLQYDMDTVRTKSVTDVLVHACAHAPDGKVASFVDVGMRVGPMTKMLRVHGDRTWTMGVLGLTPSTPKPFATRPIDYEHAIGGPMDDGPMAPRDVVNPVGIGRIARVGAPAPNCEYIDEPVLSPRFRGRLAGLGPIACHWKDRSDLAGTYDEVWTRTRRPLVPNDFKEEHHHCAPLDQQIAGALRGGESVTLINLSPEGRMSFELPKVRLGFSTTMDGDIHHHHGRLHTVIFEPTARRLIMVWQTSLPCHHGLYTLEGTVVREKRWIPRAGDQSR